MVRTGSAGGVARPSPSSPPTMARGSRLYRARNAKDRDTMCFHSFTVKLGPASTCSSLPSPSSEAEKAKRNNALQAITSHDARLRFPGSTDATAQAHETAGQFGAAGRSDIVVHATGSDTRSAPCRRSTARKHPLSPDRARSQRAAPRPMPAGFPRFRDPQMPPSETPPRNPCRMRVCRRHRGNSPQDRGSRQTSRRPSSPPTPNGS